MTKRAPETVTLEGRQRKVGGGQLWLSLLVALPALSGIQARATQAQTVQTASTATRATIKAPLKTWAISCVAPKAEEVKATLYLAQLNTMTYRVEKVQYNDAGKVILENGKGLPAVKGYHDRYLKEKQEISRPAFHSMIWAWKTFGSKFQWGPVTYHCRIS